MAADVGDQRGQRVVGQIGQQPIERGVDAAVGGRHQRLADAAGRQPQQALVLDRRQSLQPRAQPLTARPREARLQRAAPAQLVHAPAARAEQVGELARPRVGHHAIEALPVDVHDPQHVAEPADDFLAEHLGDVALVQLGVPHHHDEARRRDGATVIGQIARGEPAEGGGDGAQAHRAGGEIHDLRGRPRRYWIA